MEIEKTYRLCVCNSSGAIMVTVLVRPEYTDGVLQGFVWAACDGYEDFFLRIQFAGEGRVVNHQGDCGGYWDATQYDGNQWSGVDGDPTMPGWWPILDSTWTCSWAWYSRTMERSATH